MEKCFNKLLHAVRELVMKPNHPSDHELELHCLNKLHQVDSDNLMEHLLGCPKCVLRAEKSKEFITTMRSALLRLAQEDNPIEAVGSSSGEAAR